MKIIVTGATGLVGSEVIRQAILDKDIDEVFALTRTAPSITPPKLKIIIHKNFLDYSDCTELFSQADACIWCLGISQLQVTKDEYYIITQDYTVAAGKAMVKVNPNISFLFLSGDGADSTEQSKTLFARVKGRTENALKKVPFKQFIIARPGAIRPVHKNPKAPFLYKLIIPLFPVFEMLTPSKVISSSDLAKALLYLTKKGSDKLILDNLELKEIGKHLG